MFQYQFEMIHPFDKYNGLVGRILNQMILLSNQYKAVSFNEGVCVAADQAMVRIKKFTDIVSEDEKKNGGIDSVFQIY